jgi:DNA-binding protein H-NS
MLPTKFRIIWPSGFREEESKKSVKIRYRNPDNFSDTWTGRGRKPKWVEALLESGKTLEDIEIK